jgi:hypothetical protein
MNRTAAKISLIPVNCRSGRQLIFIGLMSLAAITIAASIESRGLALAAAICFAASVTVGGWRSATAAAARPSEKSSKENVQRQFDGLRDSACLSFLTCSWSAAALLLAYPIAGLSWRHGWEYGTAFVLVSAAFAYYLRRLNSYQDASAQLSEIRRAKSLATIQAIAITTTLLWIIGSGKLNTVKSDWMANDVFLASGLSMLALSVILVRALRNSGL